MVAVAHADLAHDALAEAEATGADTLAVLRALTLGYDKVWFGMIAILTIELGLLTPPFGMVVFAMKASLPPDVRIEEIFLGSAPFFVLLLFAVALVIACSSLNSPPCRNPPRAP